MKRKKSAYDIALNYLREKIVFKEYKQGDFISEADIAQQLNISRGPVRKALLTLQTEGLTYIQSTGRTKVLGLTSKDILDMFDLRLILEKEAINIILNQDFTDFSPILKVYKNMLSVSKVDTLTKEMETEVKKKLVDLDYRFHRSIMFLSQNRALINAWQAVTALMRELMLQNVDLISIEIERHKRIMDTLIRKESECLELVEEHLISAEEALTKLFELELSNFKGRLGSQENPHQYK